MGDVVVVEKHVLAEVVKIRRELRKLLYRHCDIDLATRIIEMTHRLEEFAEGRGRRGFWLDIRDYLADENKETVTD